MKAPAHFTAAEFKNFFERRGYEATERKSGWVEVTPWNFTENKRAGGMTTEYANWQEAFEAFA